MSRKRAWIKQISAVKKVYSLLCSRVTWPLVSSIPELAILRQKRCSSTTLFWHCCTFQKTKSMPSTCPCFSQSFSVSLLSWYLWPKSLSSICFRICQRKNSSDLKTDSKAEKCTRAKYVECCSDIKQK